MLSTGQKLQGMKKILMIRQKLDKSIVSMRDLSARLKMPGINVNTSTFSKASKIRETEPFEKIINELNKRLVSKKVKEAAQALFPNFLLILPSFYRFVYTHRNGV